MTNTTLPSLIVTGSNEKRELLESGNYLARCIQIIDKGTFNEEFQGVAKTNRKIIIVWELPTEQRVFKPENGEQPIVRSKVFTLSLSEKSTLRKFLAGWRGKDFTEDELKGFDIIKLIGKACLMNIVHKQKADGGMREDIASVSAIPKGMVCPEQINPSKVFVWHPFDEEIFNDLPEYLREDMKKTPEYKMVMSPEYLQAEIDGTDLPWER